MENEHLRLRQNTKYPSAEGVYHLRDDFQGHRIGVIYNRDHAQLIVTAVNSHAELVKALEKLIDGYDKIMLEEEHRFCDDRLVIEFDACRAALTKAKAQP